MTKREFKRRYWYPLSVDIEIRLRKFRALVNRIYIKIWPYLFGFYLMIMVSIVYCAIGYDRQWFREYANIDEPFSDRFQHWNTDGAPGQNPPEFDSTRKVLDSLSDEVDRIRNF